MGEAAEPELLQPSKKAVDAFVRLCIAIAWEGNGEETVRTILENNEIETIPIDYPINLDGDKDASCFKKFPFYALSDLVLKKEARIGFLQIFRTQTPLMMAVNRNNKNIIRLLLKHGADPNKAVYSRITAVSWEDSNTPRLLIIFIYC